MTKNNFAKHLLSTARNIQNAVPKHSFPPDEGLDSKSEQVLPFSLVRGTRGYIERVVNQINGCYENGLFDACAVMIRRLVETLIIETFEHHNIDHKIKNSNGDIVYFNDLINKTLAESTWNLGRNTKKALHQLKGIGDRAAHSRRYNAQRGDIDKIMIGFRDVVQELIYLANLK